MRAHDVDDVQFAVYVAGEFPRVAQGLNRMVREIERRHYFLYVLNHDASANPSNYHAACGGCKPEARCANIRSAGASAPQRF
jgi:hypothetical protein